MRRYLSAQESGETLYLDADEVMDLMDYFEDREDFDNYRKVLQIGLKLHGNDPFLWVRWSQVLVEDGKYKEALTILDKLDDEDDQQEIDCLKMECYCALDQYPKMLHLTQQLINEDSEYLEDAFEYVSIGLNDLGMVDKAERYTKWGLEFFPDNVTLKRELCLALESSQNFNEAIKICNELIDRYPFSYDYWYMMGRLHAAQGDLTAAIEDFDYALTCGDKTLELRVLRAYCLYMNGNYEKAIEDYKSLESKCDSKTWQHIHPLMGDCYVKTGRFKEAMEVLQPLIDNLNEEVSIPFIIDYVQGCIGLQLMNKAVETLQKAVHLHPDNKELLTLLLFALLDRAKRNSQAGLMSPALINTIDEESLSLEEREACKANVREGLKYYAQEDLEGAIACLEKVNNAHPGIPIVLFYLAICYSQAGKDLAYIERVQKLSKAALIRFIRIMDEENQMVADVVEPIQKGQFISSKQLAGDFLNRTDNRN